MKLNPFVTLLSSRGRHEHLGGMAKKKGLLTSSFLLQVYFLGLTRCSLLHSSLAWSKPEGSFLHRTLTQSFL